MQAEEEQQSPEELELRRTAINHGCQDRSNAARLSEHKDSYFQKLY